MHQLSWLALLALAVTVTPARGQENAGSRWKKSQTTVISEIDARVNTFYTRVNGVRANFIVATHNGHKYIKTENDGLHPNNLLSLPECP